MNTLPSKVAGAIIYLACFFFLYSAFRDVFDRVLPAGFNTPFNGQTWFPYFFAIQIVLFGTVASLVAPARLVEWVFEAPRNDSKHLS